MKIWVEDGKGRILRVRPEALDDLLHLYLLLDRGDFVRATTYRQVRVGLRGERGSRVRMNLTVRVEKVSFHRFSDTLRITGVIVEGPEDIAPRGSHHTISVKVGDEILLIKGDGRWNLKYVRKMLEKSRQPRVNAMVIAVDHFSVGVGLVTDQGLRELFSRELDAQSKRWGYRAGRAGLRKFLEEVGRKVAEHYLKLRPTIVIVYGPGFPKEILKDMLIAQGVPGSSLRAVQGWSGGLEGLYEALRNEEVLRIIGASMAVEDERLVSRLFREENVAYGFREVMAAAELGAVSTLLVSSRVLKEDVYGDDMVKLLREVERYGGEIRVVFSDSEAGRLLERLGGIAAILRFRVFKGGSTSS